MAEIIRGVVKHRYDTATNLTTNNPIMLEGELGIESTTGRGKFGDGSTNWNDLDYIGFTPQTITTDLTIVAMEGQQYIIKNTDGSDHTITYGGNTATAQAGYTLIFFYVNSSWVFCGSYNEDGDFIAGGNIAAVGTISGAVATPLLYDFYDQEPMQSAPASIYGGTTWENVSERAVFYHLAATSGGAETDVVTRDEVEHDNGSSVWSIDKEYAYADLIYDDVIGGSGTYAGKYIIEVDNFSGMSKRYEGGLAETFENGTLLNATQRIISIVERGNDSVGFFQNSSGEDGILQLGSATTNMLGSSSTSGFKLKFDNAGKTGKTYNTSGDGDGNEGSNPGEVRVDSYTIKKWRRVL